MNKLRTVPRLWVPYSSAYIALEIVGFSPADIPTNDQNRVAPIGALINVSIKSPATIGSKIIGYSLFAVNLSVKGPASIENENDDIAYAVIFTALH